MVSSCSGKPYHIKSQVHLHRGEVGREAGATPAYIWSPPRDTLPLRLAVTWRPGIQFLCNPGIGLRCNDIRAIRHQLAARDASRRPGSAPATLESLFPPHGRPGQAET